MSEAPPSVKLTASGLHHWLDYLTEHGVLPFNPARSVRTPRLVVREGKTPALEREQGRRLFVALDETAAGGDLLALRDRALMALMLYGFVRVGAAVAMRMRDFEDDSEHANLVLQEKGGKERRIACNHKTREYLRAYITAAGFEPSESDGKQDVGVRRWIARQGPTARRFFFVDTHDSLRRCEPATVVLALPRALRPPGFGLPDLAGPGPQVTGGW